MVQVWVYVPHYTKSKAQFERGEEGQGFRLSYYASCIILMMNNVVEQRAEINFSCAAAAAVTAEIVV